jgi:polar amino acid transport system substrate-binding protein
MKKYRWILFLVYGVALSIPHFATASVKSYCVSFQMQRPYQYLEILDGMRQYKGLDIKLMQKIVNPLGIYLHYHEQTWAEGLTALQQGSCDILLNAFKSAKRARFAYFSDSYRYAQDKFYVRNEDKDTIETVSDLLQSPQLQEMKLGVVKGYRYTNEILNAYLENPRYPSNIVYASNERQSVEDLLAGRIDGLFADRTTMDLLLWKNALGDKIAESSMNLGQKTIHVMFSKKRFNQEQVEQFNRQLKAFKQTPQYQQLIRRNIAPSFIAMTTETIWYHAIEILGTMFYAISGLLLARTAKLSFSGAFIVAMLPGIGGGVIRDVLLDRVPVSVFRTPIYFLTVVITVISGFFLIRVVYYLYPIRRFYRFFEWVKKHYHARLTNVIRATDAIGLAAFTVIGVMVAVEMQASPLWLWGPVIAVLSSCGGGIVRDFVMGVGLNRSYFYETSFIWGLFLTTYIILTTQKMSATGIFYAILITLSGIIATRLFVVKKQAVANDYWRLRKPKRQAINSSV